MSFPKNIKNIWRDLGEENEELPLYRCGSLPLRNFLIKNGMVPIDKYKSAKTGRIVFLFFKNKKVKELLTIWSDNNPNKKEGAISDE